jgi:hypothetical protein
VPRGQALRNRTSYSFAMRTIMRPYS